ncbi:MAG: hypothetical protein WC548_00800 [Candidatus Pacearchaeota archaeon]
MSDKSEVFNQSIKQKGYWNFSELYNFCFSWLEDEGYNVKEKDYQEKIATVGKEIIIKWEAKKGVTDYFDNVIEINWHILGMKDAEIEREGKKENTNKGEVKITIKANLVRDKESRWEEKPLWKFLRGIYEKYIIRTTINEYEDRLEKKVKKYSNEIKAFLQIEGR